MAVNQALTADFIGAGGQYIPQIQAHFQVTIDGLTNEDVITLAIIDWPFPSESNEIIHIRHGNTEAKLAGRFEVADATVRVRDFVDKDTQKIIEAWRTKVWDGENGIVGNPSMYKTTATVQMIGPDGTVNRSWQCLGVWPQAYSRGTMTHEAGENVEISLTLVMDRIKRLS